MAQPDLLTIREAQAALNLSGPRIHQLLADAELDGPGLAAGRKRHSPGAPRVTRESVDRYLRDRTDEDREKQALRTRTDRKKPNGPNASTSRVSEPSAKSAALEMKVRLDTMRSELAAERSRSMELLKVIDQLVSLLRSAHTSAERVDGITDGYSDALTQLLAPETPEESSDHGRSH